MRTLRLLPLLLLAVAISACGYIENRRLAAGRVLSSAVIAPLVRAQSAMPLTQERYAAADVTGAAAPSSRSISLREAADRKPSSTSVSEGRTASVASGERRTGSRSRTAPVAHVLPSILSCSSTTGHDPALLNGIVPLDDEPIRSVIGT